MPFTEEEFRDLCENTWNRHFTQADLANAWLTTQQQKLEAAKAYLKERAAAHPEWKVEKV